MHTGLGEGHLSSDHAVICHMSNGDSSALLRISVLGHPMPKYLASSAVLSVEGAGTAFLSAAAGKKKGQPSHLFQMVGGRASFSSYCCTADR